MVREKPSERSERTWLFNSAAPSPLSDGSIAAAYRSAADDATNDKESNRVIEWYKNKAASAATDYAAYEAGLQDYNRVLSAMFGA